ncbi:Golgi-specific brefeldin A-resistance guanine nucleotide exchange factor 1 [Chelonia mydas]|uniref:Golgi-specific brefeldin A-resistance guanine nucleotide exchange factor 1 n=1 Tax=Chelonia mydas TaxID=8469 RepID=M7C0Y4_CHEMY|nr:Golgi-specific brefeldin A-resistance guanine nucleotide exchange factor 1 [Chelonia mydas]
MVDKNIYIVQGEINTVVGAIKRNARWNTHTHLDEERDPLLHSFSLLKEVLNNITGSSFHGYWNSPDHYYQSRSNNASFKCVPSNFLKPSKTGGEGHFEGIKVQQGAVSSYTLNPLEASILVSDNTQGSVCS